MSDTHTTVTSQSWFSRIGSSISGTLFGLLLFLAAFVVLFWNEGRAVKTHKMLQEGAGAVISVESSSIDAANEGKLVHISGLATTGDELTDPIFEVTVNALKLHRSVEMYQWHESKSSETKKKLGGGTETVTTYSYSKKWSESLIDSSAFQKGGHDNPDAMIMESERWQAENVTLGAFRLTSSQVGGVSNEVQIPLTKDNKIKKQIAGKARLEGGTMYLGSKKHNKIGDFRIRLFQVLPTNVSIVAGQAGDSFASWKSQAGGSIAMLHTGIVPAAQMFEAAEAANTATTWILRFVGLMMMFMGLKMIVRILSVLADIVPFFGNIVGTGTSIIAFLVALVFALITIAVAWVFYRPLIAGGLIVAAIAVLGVAVMRGKKVGVAEEETAEEYER